MTIELTQEQEAFVRDEVERGTFGSPNELLDQALATLRARVRRPKSLVQFFRESPLVGLELKFERSKDTGREVIL